MSQQNQSSHIPLPTDLRGIAVSKRSSTATILKTPRRVLLTFLDAMAEDEERQLEELYFGTRKRQKPQNRSSNLR